MQMKHKIDHAQEAQELTENDVWSGEHKNRGEETIPTNSALNVQRAQRKNDTKGPEETLHSYVGQYLCCRGTLSRLLSAIASQLALWLTPHMGTTHESRARCLHRHQPIPKKR